MTLQNMVNKTVEFFERLFSSSTKLTLGVMFMVGTTYGLYQYTHGDENVTSPTVMITNLKGNSGGSGVVIFNTEDESEILTNAHVCKLLSSGGRVTTTTGQSHVVKYYKTDSDHDLCLVVVAAKFNAIAPVATKKPSLYEAATISGHPSLLPNVVSRGHFSGNKLIQVFLGVDGCSKEDFDDDQRAKLCFFFGGLPIIKTYEAGVVTALISAGSSGSAVYNDKQELAGLAFAGKGDLSYAFIVPWEYVNSFLNKNAKGKNRETFKSPEYRLGVDDLLSENNVKNNKRDAVNKCLFIQNQQKEIKIACDVIIDTIKWQD